MNLNRKSDIFLLRARFRKDVLTDVRTGVRTDVRKDLGRRRLRPPFPSVSLDALGNGSEGRTDHAIHRLGERPLPTRRCGLSGPGTRVPGSSVLGAFWLRSRTLAARTRY